MGAGVGIGLASAMAAAAGFGTAMAVAVVASATCLGRVRNMHDCLMTNETERVVMVWSIRGSAG